MEIPPIPPIPPVRSGVRRPLWSVIVPSYEQPALLERALESVLAQDPGKDNMQIEVVDDHSTTADIERVVRRVGRGRVGFTRNPANVGPPRNFTNAVLASTGHWIHILHQDDIVLPGFYEAYGERRRQTPSVMTVGPARIVDTHGSVLVETAPVTGTDGLVLDAHRQLAALAQVAFSSIVVEREAYERVGGFDPSFAYATDREMWARLARIGLVSGVEEPLVHVMYHPASDSSRLQTSIAYLSDLARAVDVMAGEHPDVRDRARVRREGRKTLATMALSVALVHGAAGRRSEACMNARWAVRFDPSPTTVARAMRVSAQALRARKAAR